MVTTILGLGAMVVTGDTVTEDGAVDGMVVITHIILITHIIPITVMGMGMGMDIGNMGIHRDEGVIMPDIEQVRTLLLQQRQREGLRLRPTATAPPPEEQLAWMPPNKIDLIAQAEVLGRSQPIAVAMAAKLFPEEVPTVTLMEIPTEAPIEVRLLPTVLDRPLYPLLQIVAREIQMLAALVAAVIEVPARPAVVRLGPPAAAAVVVDHVEIEPNNPITKT